MKKRAILVGGPHNGLEIEVEVKDEAEWEAMPFVAKPMRLVYGRTGRTDLQTELPVFAFVTQENA